MKLLTSAATFDDVVLDTQRGLPVANVSQFEDLDLLGAYLRDAGCAIAM